MGKPSARNTTIDAIKTIAALSVVFLHYNHVEGDAGEIYTRMVFGFVTFAVPFFFMTTGYFLPQLVEKHRHKDYVKKILVMALCSTTFYFVYFFSTAPDRLDWLRTHYTVGSIVMWLTGQDDPAGFHLWYFYCLLWSFVIVCTIIKYFSDKVLYVIALALVLYKFTGIEWFGCYTQSIPAITIGVLLYNYREKVAELPLKYILTVIVGVFLFIGYIGYNGHVPVSSFYGGHVMAFVIFVLAIRRPSIKHFGGVAIIGLKYSALIYILHVFVNDVLNRVICYDTVLLQVLRPWIVFGISLLLSVMCVFVKQLLKREYATHKN